MLRRAARSLASLCALQQRYPIIGDVRWLGFMIGVEFRTPGCKPDKQTAKAGSHACLDRGLMLLTRGPWENTIRRIPPLVVKSEQIDRALRIFAESLNEVVKG